MKFLTKALNKLFKSSNQQELNKIKPIIGKINDLEKSFLNFTPENFALKTSELKKTKKKANLTRNKAFLSSRVIAQLRQQN